MSPVCNHPRSYYHCASNVCPDCGARWGGVNEQRLREEGKLYEQWWGQDGKAIPKNPPTISYTMTNQIFRLEIPVEALANLSTDDHTRMLDMLNAWIQRHKPLKVVK